MDEIYPDLVVEVCGRLNDANLTWYLIGSTGLVLRGMDIGRNPKDIDILIHLSDLEDAKDCFSDCRPFCEERKLGEGHGEQFRLRIQGRQIHFCAENQNGVYFKILGDKTIHERITYKGFTIPVFPLELEEKCYAEMGRPERVKLINEFRSLTP
jgi:hypothetical protein